MWDTAFAIQAILSCNLSEEYGPTLRKAHDYVKASQVRIFVTQVFRLKNVKIIQSFSLFLKYTFSSFEIKIYPTLTSQATKTKK